MPEQPAFNIWIPAESLRPWIFEIVSETFKQQEAARAAIPERIAFSEAEAARLISLNVHQLRDERRRGRVGFSRIVRGRIRYTREDLINYLMSSRNGGQ
jgi:hypothetical protein